MTEVARRGWHVCANPASGLIALISVLRREPEFENGCDTTSEISFFSGGRYGGTKGLVHTRVGGRAIRW